MNKKIFWLFFLVFIVGLVLRLVIAYNFYGSNDVGAWEQYSTYWQQGLSPYEASHRYNYGPLWYYVISFFSFIGRKFCFPFHFVIKFPLILADIFILFSLIAIGKKLKFSDKKLLFSAGLFFLNPVSVLITGYHGQFGNIALFFTLCAYYFFAFNKNAPLILGSLFLSIAIGFKHFIVMLVPTLAFWQKRLLKSLFVMFAAPLMFLITILPYLISDTHWVINNVFRYNLHAGYWGWSGVICRSILFFFKIDIIKMPWFKIMDFFNPLLYIGIFGASYFIVKKYNLLDSIIIIFLIFYSFTTQIAPQYTVWIIPFAVFRRNKYLYWYSAVGTIQLLTFFYSHHHWRLNIPFKGTIPNLIPETFIIFRYLTWVVCVLWLGHMLNIKDKLLCLIRRSSL